MLEWVKQKSNFFFWENKHVKNFPNPHVIPPPYYHHIFLPGPQIKLFTHISSVEGLHSKIFTDVSTLLQICSIDMWQFYPHPGEKNLHLPSLSIPMPQIYLRLTSCLRGTSLLCFSNVPSNHCWQSNRTLNSEYVSPSCWIFFCGSHKWNQIQGINPPSSPCSFILHTSVILNHNQSSKWSLFSLFFVLLSNLLPGFFVNTNSTECLSVD